jgi:hypothetical protein
LRKDLPKAAESVILKALSWEPADRYSSAELFGNALATALLSPAAAPLRSARYRAIAIGAGCLIVVLSAISGFRLFQLPDPGLPPVANPPVIAHPISSQPAQPVTPDPVPPPAPPTEKKQPAEAPQAPAAHQTAAINIEGIWSVPVQYGRHIAGGEPVWNEEYRLRVVDGQVMGTATMFEYPYAVLNGQLNGSLLTFSVYQQNGDGTTDRELRYRGNVEPDKIHFIHQDMKTGKIIEFTAAKSFSF